VSNASGSRLRKPDHHAIEVGGAPLTGPLLDRLTHRANILEMNDESYRLAQGKQR
jgi:hypothetical protein